MFKTEKYMKESLYVFDTQYNESTNNAITYVSPKTRRWCIAQAYILGYLVWW